MGRVGANCGGVERGGRRVGGERSLSGAVWKGSAALAVVGLLACGAPGDEGAGRSRPAAPAFDAVFTLIERIALEEPDSALITALDELAVDRGGRLLIAEPAAGEARIYARDGRLLRRLGRRGDGPGEFRRPMSATFGPGGSVYVSDTGSPRVTRFASGPMLDTVFPLAQAFFGGPLRSVPGGVVVFAMRHGPGALLFDVYDAHGRPRSRFHRLHPLIGEVPGWLSAARSRVAVGAGSIFVAENLFYPIVRYDPSGTPLDSLGTPPPSWRPASRPEPGRFQGPEAWSRFALWRRSFTTIAALGVYRDSLLLVAHEALDPRVVAYEEASYRLDIYSLRPALTKLAEDVRLPGPLLQAGEAVYLLLGRPPEADAWTMGRYELKVPRR